MNISGLVASAAINIGLAIVVLSLFSILKKQNFNAPVYYARRLARGDRNLMSAFVRGFNIRPSVAWVSHAFRTTDEDVARDCGLDALVVIRLFKIGIRFFVVCSTIGLLILVPVNYSSQEDQSLEKIAYSIDPFSIANVPRGSNRLWVHFICLYLVSFYAFYLLYTEYKGILGRRICEIHTYRHCPAQFTVLVRGVPFCAEHKSWGCSVDHFFSKHYAYSYNSYQIIYDGKNLEHLIKLAAALEKKIRIAGQQELSSKHRSSSLVSTTLGETNSGTELYRETLQHLYRKIRQLQCENVLKQKELPVAFVSFKARYGAALAAQSQQHSHPLRWITEPAPQPRDVLWKNLAIPYRILVLQKIGAFVAASLLTIFFTLPVTAVQGIVRFEKLKKWFPPVRAVQLIPGLSSILTGYLPSVILNCFIYVIPYAMLGISCLEGHNSRSKMEIRACSMVFYFLMGNVFFLSLLSGSLLDEIGESFTHPRDIPSRLATAVSAQADFFITYILTDGLSGFSLEILQIGLITLHFVKTNTFSRDSKDEPELYSMQFYRVIPFVSLAILIGMVYAVVAPLLLPFLLVYLFLGYAVYINQMHDVYEFVYQTYGQYWPCIHHYICISIIIMQITMIGLFGLKSKPAASISTIPLLLATILFNEYCKVRFLPTFDRYPVQNAMENDDSDTIEGPTEDVISEYCPPWLRPVGFNTAGSSIEPLVISS